MKRISINQACMRMFMTCLTVLLTIQAFGAPKSKTVDYPLIEFGTTEALDIAKVELTKRLPYCLWMLMHGRILGYV